MKGILGVVLVCVWVNSFSQNTLSGYVYSGDNQPVVGATVILSDLNKATITDFQGEFILHGITQEIVEVEISSVGFNSQTLQIGSSGYSKKQQIKLIESVVNLPEIVVESITMTGGLSQIKNRPGSAYFISQKEIQKFSYTDINRTLRNVPGVNMQEEDGYGLRPNIGLRATGSERSSKITVMEDGILAAAAPYAAPAAYYFPSIGRMEAIEIMKGSSQIKYGPFTTGGAINLISTPIPLEFAGHADFIAGSDGYKMIHAHLGNSHKNVGYLVETLQYGADGFKNLDNGGNTGFKKEDYIAKIRVNTNEDAAIYQSLQFKVGQADEISNETYLGLSEQDFELTPFRRYSGSQNDVMNTEHRQYAITHYIQATSFLDIVTNVYRNEFDRNWYKLDKVNGISISNILNSPNTHTDELSIVRGELDVLDALSVKANNRSYYSRGVQTNFITHFRKGKVSHKIDFSVRLHEDQIDRFQWVDSYDMENGIMKLTKPGVPGTESNRIETADAFSSYLQYRLSFEKLTLTPGLRYENITISRSDFGKEDPQRQGSNISNRKNEVHAIIPGLAAQYEIDQSFSFFGGIHKGFAPPGSKEGTKPEESWNYEIGSRYHNGAFRLQATGYFNNYSNLLGSDLAASGGLGSTDLFNGGKARATGLEIEGTYDMLHGKSNGVNMPVSLAYTHTTATFQSSFDSDFDPWGSVQSGYHLPYVPKHQLALSFSLEHSRYLFDVSGKYNSDMLAQAGHFDDENLSRTKGYFTVDVSLNYRLTPIISVFGNINNVLDRIYIASLRPAGLRPGLPRMFKFGLKANF